MIRTAAAAAAVVLLAGANGCCACAASKPYERRSAAAESPGAPVPLSPPVVRVLHFGDFGEANCQQAAVASAIEDAQRRRPFDLALHVGDNLYDCGPDWRSTAAGRCAFGPDGATVAPGFSPPRDPSFHEKFEGALDGLARAGVPVYLALGNHDVATWGSCLPIGDPVAVSRAKACLEVAHAGPAWRFPARHYVIESPPPPAAPLARFIVVDSNVLRGDYGGFTLADEVAFVAGAAVGCDKLPCFLVGHHPAATAGKHTSDFDAGHVDRLAQLLAAAGPDLRGWLAGHDHDLQHLRTPTGLDVFVSGNGCRDRTDERFEHPAPAGATLLYGTVRWGYAVLEVSADAFTWRVEDDRGSPRYCCAATRAGAAWTPCDPVRCE
ncbi:MAG TPA: metallophosphoesterase [Anaeromyxobacteraceae bacterium]|nr:metallophosphoesterase [Anaeromyxobacteraceae bacterium]